MTEAEWATLADKVPPAIADGYPLQSDRLRPVTVEALARVIRP